MTLPRVPVAARDLPRNHFVRASDVELRAVTVNPPVGTVATADQVVDRYLRVPKARGDMFTDNDVAATPVLPLTDGRLISLGLDAQMALGGLLDPGQIVDVFGTPKGAANDPALPGRIGAGLRVVVVLKQATAPTVIVVVELPKSDDGPAAATEAEATCRRLVGATDLRLVVCGA